MSKPQEVTEQKGNQVVHIRSDSDSLMESLFVMSLKPDQRPAQVPLHLRNLPKSFFIPPATGSKSPSVTSVSHSRENSGDSGRYTIAPPQNPGPQVLHSRAQSSPASLQHTLAAAQQAAQHSHLRTNSFDLLDDPLGPLPPGWEQARTPEGLLYFLNHNTQTTTWDDPRKKSPQSDTGSSTPSPHPAQNHAPLQSYQQVKAIGPLPDGWEQAMTPQGEIYFIDHATKVTTWFDPRIPQHLQKPPMVVNPAMLNQTSSSPTVSTAQSQQQQQQKLRLQRLQNERERLRERQQLIMQQMAREQGKIRHQENHSTVASPPSLINNLKQTVSGQQSSSTVGTNSALQQQQTASIQLIQRGVASGQQVGSPIAQVASPSQDYPHARQESTDSGLGMTANYSMPHTPEDFLASIDDTMDHSIDTDLNGPSSVNNADMVETSMPAAMDTTDDLVPTLEFGEELSNDILNDVLLNSGKVDNVLTWL
ncbi:transcriptional coactivator YAP1-like [Artemia franciscana]|uniref:transcriptional coactivator YAP1-like n=1 Tax=Artemia franciscana TaxID=6661 RepID=UPI0032DB15CD